GYALQIAALLLSIELLHRLFLSGSGMWGLGLAAILVFSLRGTWSTINFGQTNFLVLLFLLLYWRDRKIPRAGVWLALGIFVQLYVVLVLLYPLLRRQWSVLAYTVVSSLLLAAASLAVLGPTTFVSYFTLDPASHLPNWVYMERINQSLLAVILRSSNTEMRSVFLFSQPLYLILASYINSVISYLVYRARHDSDWGLAFVLATALLIYPGSLSLYPV